jgi:hypothetical protein
LIFTHSQSSFSQLVSCVLEKADKAAVEQNNRLRSLRQRREQQRANIPVATATKGPIPPKGLSTRVPKRLELPNFDSSIEKKRGAPSESVLLRRKPVLPTQQGPPLGSIAASVKRSAFVPIGEYKDKDKGAFRVVKPRTSPQIRIPTPVYPKSPGCPFEFFSVSPIVPKLILCDSDSETMTDSDNEQDFTKSPEVCDKKECKTLRKKYAKLSRNFDITKEALDNANLRIGDQGRHGQQLHFEKKKLMEEKESLELQVKNLTDGSDSAKQIASLTNELAVQNVNLDLLTKSTKRAKSAAETANKDVVGLQDCIFKLNQEIAAYKIQVAEMQASQPLSGDTGELHTKIKELEMTLANKMTYVAQCNQNLNSKDSALVKYEKKVKEAAGEILDLKNQVKDLTKQVKDAQTSDTNADGKELKKAKAEIVRLNDKLVSQAIKKALASKAVGTNDDSSNDHSGSIEVDGERFCSLEEFKKAYVTLKKDNVSLNASRKTLIASLQDAKKVLQSTGKVADFECSEKVKKEILDWINKDRKGFLVMKFCENDDTLHQFCKTIYSALKDKLGFEDTTADNYTTEDEFIRKYSPHARTALGAKRTTTMSEACKSVQGALCPLDVVYFGIYSCCLPFTDCTTVLY